MEKVLRSETDYQGPLFTRPVRLLVAAEAELLMRAETRPYLSDDLETGGILVGRWLDETTLLVFTATGAGPQADHQRLTFAVDVDYANRRLEELRLAYPLVDYVGEWHKHPPHFPRPSVGDLHTSLELLQDPAYPNRLLNPIVTEAAGQININYFYLDAALADFVQLQPEIVDERRVAALLDPPSFSPPRPVASVGRRPRLSPKKSAWWHSLEGRQRLQEEIKQLQNHGYLVKASEKLDESTWRIQAVATKGAPSEFEFQCGGNYPFARPDFSAFEGGKFDGQARSALLSNWQSENYLYEICQDVRQQRKDSHKPVRLLGFIGAGLLVLLAGILIWFILQQSSLGATPPGPGNTASDIAGQQTATAQAAYAAITASVLKEQATKTAQAQVTATAQAIEQARVDALQATVAAQNQALTAAAQPASPAVAPPTPAPSVGGNPETTPASAGLPYRLAIYQLSADLYNQKLAQDHHEPTPFHLLAEMSDASLVGLGLKLQFPNTTVSLPSNPSILTSPFNDFGLGCQPDAPCPVVVVDENGQNVSPVTIIPKYDPQSYYVFTLQHNG
ncbi:MAG: hypothetical protein J0I20_11610 [Chloroflexi bacterium]|nr:hypothetical protein [Chloroflexota bacterium]OJV92382.1 MAG: hypothetical protein BGO39_31130 [Chloroflexi bacterium 54-19]